MGPAHAGTIGVDGETTSMSRRSSWRPSSSRVRSGSGARTSERRFESPCSVAVALALPRVGNGRPRVDPLVLPVRPRDEPVGTLVTHLDLVHRVSRVQPLIPATPASVISTNDRGVLPDHRPLLPRARSSRSRLLHRKITRHGSRASSPHSWSTRVSRWNSKLQCFGHLSTWAWSKRLIQATEPESAARPDDVAWGALAT